MTLNFTNLEATIQAKLNSLTATVTAASANGTTVTYIANNAFSAGQVVTITGLSTQAFNLQNVTIATASPTQFTITNASTGTAVTNATGSAAIIVDSKELLLQMKALESATTNLSLGKVVSEGLYQQGLISQTGTAAIASYNAIVSTATANINSLLNQLGSVNTQAIIDLVTQKLADINTATNTAIASVNSAASSAQTTATNAISSAQTTATNAVTAQQSTSISAVQSAASSAQSTAVTAITNAKNSAIDEINTTVTGSGLAAVNTSLTSLNTRLTTLEANSPQALIYSLID